MSKIISKEDAVPLPIEHEKWNKWECQIGELSITTKKQLEEFIELTEDENEFFDTHGEHLKFRITPYYMSVMLRTPALRKTLIPSIKQTIVSDGESSDPLDEEKFRKTENLIHKYSNRALFLSTNFCSNYCQFCTRSRLVYEPCKKNDTEESFDYIKNHPEINDLIFSGGDVLTLPDNEIEYLLRKASEIESIDIIRIGTKMITVAPMRITNNLISILKKYKPYINIHLTHPSELTPEFISACRMLSDNGLVIRSQTVLLKDVNNSVKTLSKLFMGALKNYIAPYYAYIADENIGSSYFRVPIDEAKDLFKQLRLNISGMAIPTLILDSKNYKIPIGLDM